MPDRAAFYTAKLRFREQRDRKAAPPAKRAMKTLFIDCNPQFELVFRRVYRTDDPEVDVNNMPFRSADLPRMLDGYGICIDDHSYMPTDVMKACRALKHIVFCGTGASSYMDVAALADLGITVHTFRGYGDTAVAEHTIALMFACARDVAASDRRIRGGRWEPLEGVQLRGKTLGVIGLGGIGREVARIGHGIGMNVIGWNRTQHADLGVPLVELDTLLSTSDVISLNLSLFDETRGFLDAKRVSRIKAGRDPRQHRPRRTRRRSRVDRRVAERTHPPRRTRRLPRRAAQSRSPARHDGQRDALPARRVPHAGGFDEPVAPRARHRAQDRGPPAGVTRLRGGRGGALPIFESAGVDESKNPTLPSPKTGRESPLTPRCAPSQSRAKKPGEETSSR